jgi:hypothetical protein
MTISRTQIPKTQRGRQNPDDGHHDLKFNERYHLFGLILFNHSDDELPLRLRSSAAGILAGLVRMATKASTTVPLSARSPTDWDDGDQLG